MQCVNNCGFHGSSDTNGLCSQCFKNVSKTPLKNEVYAGSSSTAGLAKAIPDLLKMFSAKRLGAREAENAPQNPIFLPEFENEHHREEKAAPRGLFNPALRNLLNAPDLGPRDHHTVQHQQRRKLAPQEPKISFKSVMKLPELKDIVSVTKQFIEEQQARLREYSTELSSQPETNERIEPAKQVLLEVIGYTKVFKTDIVSVVKKHAFFKFAVDDEIEFIVAGLIRQVETSLFPPQIELFKRAFSNQIQLLTTNIKAYDWASARALCPSHFALTAKSAIGQSSTDPLDKYHPFKEDDHAATASIAYADLLADFQCLYDNILKKRGAADVLRCLLQIINLLFTHLPKNLKQTPDVILDGLVYMIIKGHAYDLFVLIEYVKLDLPLETISTSHLSFALTQIEMAFQFVETMSLKALSLSLDNFAHFCRHKLDDINKQIEILSEKTAIVSRESFKKDQLMEQTHDDHEKTDPANTQHITALDSEIAKLHLSIAKLMDLNSSMKQHLSIQQKDSLSETRSS